MNQRYPMFPLLDRYLFLEWSKVFLLTIGVILGVLILEDMYDDLSDLLSYGARLESILVYYGVLLPSFLPLILPIGFLVSLLVTVGSFHKNSEIVSMRSSGLSLWRISRVLWIVGLLLSLFLLYLNARAVPWSVETSRELLNVMRFASEAEAKGADEVGLVPNLSFDNARENRLWFMNAFSERAYLGTGVTVFSRNEAGREYYRIMAREGLFNEETGYWSFLEGRELYFSETGEPVRSIPFERLEKPVYTESPQLMMALNKRPKDLSLFEISGILQQVSPGENPRVTAYLVQYYEILAGPFSCLVVVGLAIPFAVAGVRTSPMVGVSKSVGYFLAFYFLANFSAILGERGVIPALPAAWFPYVFMLAIGLVFFHRQR